MEAIRIGFDLREAEMVARAFRHAPALAQRILGAAATEASLLIQRESQENTPTAFGTLRESIEVGPTRVMADRIIGVVGSALPYAEPVELGTRPHRPPIQPLADWAKVKLGIPEDEAKGVAFAVAAKIEREGTEGHFMMTQALEENREQVATIFRRGLRRLAVELKDLGQSYVGQP